jgi:ketosteroid isomerase-like protein
MSHTETIQAVYAAFSRGDIPALMALLSESVEWGYGEGTTDVPWLQRRQGRTGAGDFFASLAQIDLQRFTPKVFLEHPQERVVVVLLDVEFVVKATGRRVVEEDEIHIFWFDAAGRISRYRHQVDTYQHYIAYHGETAPGAPGKAPV